VVLPFAWQNKKATIETVKVKEISTPQCRRLSKPAGNAKASRRATLAESVEGKTGTDASSEVLTGFCLIFARAFLESLASLLNLTLVLVLGVPDLMLPRNTNRYRRRTPVMRPL